MSTEHRAEASLSVAALHLLLATHDELDDLPIEWTIDVERVIRPSMRVRHPDCAKAARLLADALELDLRTNDFSDGGIPTRSLYVQGRWGGATWDFVAYATREAGEAS